MNCTTTARNIKVLSSSKSTKLRRKLKRRSSSECPWSRILGRMDRPFRGRKRRVIDKPCILRRAGSSIRSITADTSETLARLRRSWNTRKPSSRTYKICAIRRTRITWPWRSCKSLLGKLLSSWKRLRLCMWSTRSSISRSRSWMMHASTCSRQRRILTSRKRQRMRPMRSLRSRTRPRRRPIRRGSLPSCSVIAILRLRTLFRRKKRSKNLMKTLTINSVRKRKSMTSCSTSSQS